MATYKRGTLLIVEDDIGLQNQLRLCFEDYDVTVADDHDSALAQVRRVEPQVVTLDVGLPPDPGGVSVGLQTLQDILSLAPQTKVVVVTGDEDREATVRAIGLGAYDFYIKPLEGEVLKFIVNRAYRVHELEEENKRLTNQHGNATFNGIITNAEPMQKICRTIEKVAPTDASTLLLGESGTGKELLARALHELSPRHAQRFIAINCAAIPENLLESELFGYEKGAFTGAAKQTLGKIEVAHQGTLFLDEIGDLPMSLQAKLLRFLQERVIERVGGREEIQVNVRVVCATHRDLQALIKSGVFREDLYYRLSEITIIIPALRERAGDAVLLAKAFLERFTTVLGRTNIRGYTQDALAAIDAYNWPGNVRELENRVKRALIMAEGTRITPDEMELTPQMQNDLPFNLRQVRETAESGAIMRALEYTSGNVAKTADLLGVSRPTLYDLLNKYELKPK
ncbi:MAG: PEP-CTERM-box response regulator transcription factor [Pseudomonadota bacterium]